MKLLFQILLFLLISYLTGCSNTAKKTTESVTTRNPEIVYSEALNEFESENYETINFEIQFCKIKVEKVEPQK